jgi:hypothetical protein
MKVFVIVILALVFSSYVKNKNGVGMQSNVTADGNKFEVAEVIQANNYTYLKVKALPEMGDEVTFKGKISVNKDFGSGYRYDVIMEEAVLVNKKAAKQAI